MVEVLSTVAHDIENMRSNVLGMKDEIASTLHVNLLHECSVLSDVRGMDSSALPVPLQASLQTLACVTSSTGMPKTYTTQQAQVFLQCELMCDNFRLSFVQ
jgi:hypothetical protein